MQQLGWAPVDPAHLADLPAPWHTLKECGFSPTLYDRVQRFWTAVVEDGKESILRDAIVLLGESFLPQNAYRSDAHALSTDPSFPAEDWLHAVEGLAKEFPSISPILWNTIATIGQRPNPHEEASILDVQDYLPYTWGICDAALHALSKSFSLFFHTEERLREKTGHILLHGCGCSHIMNEIGTAGGAFPTLITAEQKATVSKEWLDHFLSELYLIHVSGFPFRMNPEDLKSVQIIGAKNVSIGT